MSRLEELIRQLPPELEREVEDFIDFVLAKRERVDLDRYDTVKLQHKAMDWMTEDALARHERAARADSEPAPGS